MVVLKTASKNLLNWLHLIPGEIRFQVVPTISLYHSSHDTRDSFNILGRHGLVSEEIDNYNGYVKT